MPKEFHIFASEFENRFLVKRVGEMSHEFGSLVEATRHVRLQLCQKGGMISVYNGKSVNRIPIHPNASPPAATAPNTRSAKRILVVDDELGFTRLLKLILEKTGRYDVHAEHDGTNALRSALDFRPDLVLLDQVMPKISGSQVAMIMQSEPRLREIPILFLSGSIRRNEEGPTQISGFSALAKPVGIRELVEAIETKLPALT